MKSLYLALILIASTYVQSSHGKGQLFEEIHRLSFSPKAEQNNNQIKPIDSLLVNLELPLNEELKKNYIIEYAKPKFNLSLFKSLQNKKYEQFLCNSKNFKSLKLVLGETIDSTKQNDYLRNKIKSLSKTIGFQGSSCGDISKISVKPDGLRELIFTTGCIIKNQAVDKSTDLQAIPIGYTQIKEELQWSVCNIKKKAPREYPKTLNAFIKIELFLKGLNLLKSKCSDKGCKNYWKMNNKYLPISKVQFPNNNKFIEELELSFNKLGFRCNFLSCKEEKVDFIQKYARASQTKIFVKIISDAILADVNVIHDKYVKPSLPAKNVLPKTKTWLTNHLKNLSIKLEQINCESQDYKLCTDYQKNKELLDRSTSTVDALTTKNKRSNTYIGPLCGDPPFPC